VRLAEREKPVTCSVVILGRVAGALGAVTASTSAGPLWESASRRASRTFPGCSARMPWAPTALATAAQSVCG
jgi:hypothetical protein